MYSQGDGTVLHMKSMISNQVLGLTQDRLCEFFK